MLTRTQLLLLVVLALVLGGLRLIHLTGDTPSWVSPYSAGEYVDEGYKTLSARNLTLFGETHWHPLDDYPGWMGTSPLTQGMHYIAFRWFGANLATARTVTILAFTAFLVTCVVVLRTRFPVAVLAMVLVLLALDPGLFFFSRIALFETPVIVLLYGWLLVLARVPERMTWQPLLATLAVAPVLAFAVKASALVYLAPILLALGWRSLVLRDLRSSRWFGAGVTAMVFGGLLLLWFTRHVWWARLAFDPAATVSNLLSNPAIRISPFLFLSGWLCALHLALCRPAQVLASPWRSSMVAMVLLGPFLFAPFLYNPPRYHLPFLPAFAFVVGEWVRLGGYAFIRPERGRWLSFAIFLVLVFWIFSVARAFNYAVLANLPWALGDSPGLGDRWLILLAFPPALLAAAWIWWQREHWLRGRYVAAAVAVALLAFVAHAAYLLGQFMRSPRYDGDRVRLTLETVLPPGSTVAGDWAPFFALGTDLRPLYMNRRFNAVSRAGELRAQYFLHSDTADSHASFEGFNELPDVRLGPVLMEETYNDRFVRLYPILHPSSSPPHASTSAP